MHSSPIIIDIEASGFGAESYPIEVGVVLEDGERYSSLIHPHSQWTHWDDHAELIHHISRSNLIEFGRPINLIANNLNQILRNKTVYSDGWVVDKPWIDQLFYNAGVEMQFHVSPLELILVEEQMRNWHLTKQEVINESNMTRHRASFDAWIIQETFRRTSSVYH